MRSDFSLKKGMIHTVFFFVVSLPTTSSVYFLINKKVVFVTPRGSSNAGAKKNTLA